MVLARIVEPTCKADGAECDDPAECCSPYCVQGSVGPAVCNDAQCLPDQAECDPESDLGECCSGNCDPMFQRCVQACAGPGDGCVDGGDCCDGNCDQNNGECACRPDGSPCEDHGDCCGSLCNQDFVCGSASCLPPLSDCDPADQLCCYSIIQACPA